MNFKNLYQKPIFLPILISFTYLSLLLDTFKYPGFVGKHFLIDAKFIASIPLVIILLSSKGYSRFLKNITLFILVVGFITYLYFAFIEASNFMNYVLTKYHFSLEGLIYILVFSLFVFLLSDERIKNIFKIKFTFWHIILILLFIYTLLANFGKTLNKAMLENVFVLANLNYSYDEKMIYQWGKFYDYMVFVNNNSPQNATIIIPPHLAPWWNRSGDLNLVRSFLYPRNLVQYDTENIPDLGSIPRGTYILVAWGEWGCEIEGMCRGWPVEEIKVKEFIVKDSNSPKAKEIRKDIIYDPSDTSNPFGLIKL